MFQKTFLLKIWDAIQRILRAIGMIQTAIILGLFYYLILGPFAILYKLSRLLVKIPKNPKSYWIKKPQEPVTPEKLIKQY